MSSKETFTQYIKIAGKILKKPVGSARGTLKLDADAIRGQIHIINGDLLKEQEAEEGKEREITFSIPFNYIYVSCLGEEGDEVLLSYNDMYDANGGVPAPLEASPVLISVANEKAISFKSNKEREIFFMANQGEGLEYPGQTVGSTDTVHSTAPREDGAGCEIVVLLVVFLLAAAIGISLFAYKSVEHLRVIRDNTQTIVEILKTRIEIPKKPEIKEARAIISDKSPVFEIKLLPREEALIEKIATLATAPIPF